jgi:hypothetical protein
MKAALFHILRTFRWPIVWGCNILSFLCVLTILLVVFGPVVSGGTWPTDSPDLFMIFVLAVFFNLAGWSYDVLLKKLEPKISN